MRRSGSSGPLRIHLIPTDPVSAERIRSRIRERRAWTLTVGLSCRIPPEADLVMLPAGRCRECLGGGHPDGAHPDGAHPGSRHRGGPAYLAYGPPEHLRECALHGCSDYLKDPWDLDELEFRLGRCAAPLRFTAGAVTVRLEPTRVVSELGSSGITAAEWAVLELLLRRAGEPVSRDALFYAVWGAAGGDSRLVDVYVSRLRRRLAEVLPPGGLHDPLRSIRGYGYTLDV
jgi:hypothetical protein